MLSGEEFRDVHRAEDEFDPGFDNSADNRIVARDRLRGELRRDGLADIYGIAGIVGEGLYFDGVAGVERDLGAGLLMAGDDLRVYFGFTYRQYSGQVLVAGDAPRYGDLEDLAAGYLAFIEGDGVVFEFQVVFRVEVQGARRDGVRPPHHRRQYEGNPHA